MATNFPTSLDNFTNPSSGNTLDSPSHSLQHSDANDAIEAIEAKLGVGASPAGSATAGQVLTISAAGTSGWSTPTSDGLIHINTTSFSAVASQSISNVFSSTYDNYKIELVVTNSTSATCTMRFRTGVGDDSTSNYAYQHLRADGTTVTATRSLSQTALNLTPIAISSYQTVSMEVFSPNLAAYTQIRQIGLNYGDFVDGAYFHITSTQFTGFSLIASTGTITGKVSVYGYRL